MSKPYFYVSVDIETDGPVPALHSMRSIGCVAYYPNGKLVGSDTHEAYRPKFYRTIQPLANAKHDQRTMDEFWSKWPEAWEEVNTNTDTPLQVMRDLVSWLGNVHTNYKARPVFVAYPAGFDFTFVHWYMHRFIDRDPFGFAALDLKSYAAALLGVPFTEVWKGSMPKEWFDGCDWEGKRPHHALDDAEEQGRLFFNMLEWAERLGRWPMNGEMQVEGVTP